MQDGFSDALFDLEDESLGAGQLVAVHAVAHEFQFVFMDALFDVVAWKCAMQPRGNVFGRAMGETRSYEARAARA
jgi:hypothetical protein